MRHIAAFFSAAASSFANGISLAAVAAASVVITCALVGCGVDPGVASSTDGAPATLTEELGGAVGQVCDRGSKEFVSGAMVTAYRSDDALERSAHADDAGTFSMDMPAGDYVGYTWAAGTAFSKTFSFSVRAGAVTQVFFDGCDGSVPTNEVGFVYALDSAKSLVVK